MFKDDESAKMFGVEQEEETLFDFTKSNDEKQIVFGWASVTVNADGSIPLDWQDDVIPTCVLESAAYQYVLKYRETGVEHVGEAVGTLIESVMFTKDKMTAIGIPHGVINEGWWIGFYIPDKAVFESIKSGHYRMFSIQGKIRKVKL